MGERKIKQMNDKTFLSHNIHCIYCGGKSTTVDHCPPRCFFQNRHWPEGFRFAACDDCNQSAKNDEQVVATLIRISLKNLSAQEEKEWKKQITGLINNRKNVIHEWLKVSANEQKRIFKTYFGDSGDLYRYDGYKAIKIGPITRGILRNFATKLGMALYYKHTSQIFEGVIYTACTNTFEHSNLDQILSMMNNLAPNLIIPTRANKKLDEQFAYKYSWDEHQGAFCAFVNFFNKQLIFHIIAVNSDISEKIDSFRSMYRFENVYDKTICQLNHKSNE